MIMNARIVLRKELNQLLEKLAQEKLVYAPVRDKKGTVWRQIHSSTEVCLDDVPTYESAKGLIFPRTEVMLEFKEGEVWEADGSLEQIIFGLRPCDGSAFAFLRKFFTEEGKVDIYVQRRIEKTLFIGVACNKIAPTCFCVGVGGSPVGTRGLDLLLTNFGEKFLAEPLTDKGAGLVKGFPEASPEDVVRKKKLVEEVKSLIQTQVDTQRLKKKLDNGFDHPLWETLALPCVNCGACTFLCPTCHCFDVTDETLKDKTCRFRVWDSCQFTMYSQHASGHNPRLQPHARFRNRIMDKFKFTVDMVGEISCVGCGRCIIACPVGIDIRETVAAILQNLEEG